MKIKELSLSLLMFFSVFTTSCNNNSIIPLKNDLTVIPKNKVSIENSNKFLSELNEIKKKLEGNKKFNLKGIPIDGLTYCQAIGGTYAACYCYYYSEYVGSLPNCVEIISIPPTDDPNCGVIGVSVNSPVISPKNQDGVLDKTRINVIADQNCGRWELKVEGQGQTWSLISGGTNSINFGGLDNSGNYMTDGMYTVTVTQGPRTATTAIEIKNTTDECEKSLTPTDLNPLMDLFSSSNGFTIQADNQSKLLSDIKEFNSVINSIKNQQNKITEIQNSNDKNKVKKIANIQVKLNDFLTRRDAIKQIITDKVTSLENQANNILSQANTLSFDTPNIDLTSSSTTPLGIYKDKIEILNNEFNNYISYENTYELVTASKIYVQEVYLYKELMDKYLNQEIQDDISLSENIDTDDDLEAGINKLTNVSKVVRFFSRKIDNQVNRIVKEQAKLKVKFYELQNESEVAKQDYINVLNDLINQTDILKTSNEKLRTSFNEIESNLNLVTQTLSDISDTFTVSSLKQNSFGLKSDLDKNFRIKSIPCGNPVDAQGNPLGCAESITQGFYGEISSSIGFEAAGLHLLNKALGNISLSNTIIPKLQSSQESLKNQIKDLNLQKAGANSSIEKQQIQNKIDSLNQQSSKNKMDLARARDAKKIAEAEAEKAKNNLNEINDNKKAGAKEQAKVDKTKLNFENKNSEVKNITSSSNCISINLAKIKNYLKETLLNGAKATDKSFQYIKYGDYQTALNDYKNLTGDGKYVTNEKSIFNKDNSIKGKCAEFKGHPEIPDGITINVRETSTHDGDPTIEIRSKSTTPINKTRYNKD